MFIVKNKLFYKTWELNDSFKIKFNKSGFKRSQGNYFKMTIENVK